MASNRLSLLISPEVTGEDKLNSLARQFDSMAEAAERAGKAADADDLRAYAESLKKAANEQADIAGLSGELKRLADAGLVAREEAERMADSYDKLGNSLRIGKQFEAVSRQVEGTKTALDGARQKLAELEAQAASGGATAGLTKKISGAEKEVDKLTRQLEQQNNVLHETSRQAIEAGVGLNNLEQQQAEARRATDELAGSMKKLAEVGNARDMLGVKSHAAVRAEIDRLKAAYETLRTTGGASFSETSQAAVALRQRIRELERSTGSWGSALASKVTVARTAVAAFMAVVVSAIAAAYRYVAGVESLSRSFEKVTGSSQAAARELQFVRDAANQLGLPVQTLTKSYLDLMAATKGTTLQGEQTRAIFLSVTGAMSALGKSSADTEGALQAIQQMISKGKVSAEELRGQLGERLPGAFKMFADSIGVSTAELDKMLQSGSLLAEDVLPRFADELGRRLPGDANSLNGEMAALGNTLTNTGSALGGMFTPAMRTALSGIREIVAVISVSVAGLAGLIAGIGQSLGVLSAALVTFNWQGVGAEITDIWDRIANVIRGVRNESVIFRGEGAAARAELEAQAQKLGVTVEEYVKLSEAQKKAAIEQQDLRINLARASATYEEYFKQTEATTKASIEQAKAEAELARAKKDQAGEAAALARVKKAEADLAVLDYQRKETELTLAQQKLESLNAEEKAVGQLSETKQKERAELAQTVAALTGQAGAYKATAAAATESAKEGAKAAGKLTLAYQRLGMVSSAAQKKNAADLKSAFEEVQKAAANGEASQEDVKKAFLKSAEAALRTGDAISNAQLRTQAATLGVEDQFNQMAEAAGRAGAAGVDGMDKIGKAGRDAERGLHGVGKAGEDASQVVTMGVSRMAESVSNDTGSVAAYMAHFIDGLYSNLGHLSAAARNEFAQMKGAVNRIDTSQSQTQIERLTDALHKSKEEMGQFYDAMVSGSQDGVGISLGLAKMAVDAKAVEIRFYEQAIAAENLRQNLEKMDVTAQSAELSADNLSKQFNLLDKSQLTGLIEQVDRVNSKIRQTRDEAARATEALNGMAESAQESIDRANGDQVAIERRKFNEEIAKVNALAAQGGDAGAAAQARAHIKKAYDIRVAEIEAEKKAELQRKADETGRPPTGPGAAPGQGPVVNRPGQGQQQPGQTQPSRVVQIDLSVNGQRQSVNVASDADAETLVRTLEDLKRRMR